MSVLWPPIDAVLALAEPVIKNAEGFFARPYICPAGKPTIGWGTTRYPDSRPVSLTDQMVTQIEAQVFLEASAKRVFAGLQKPGLVTRAPTVHQAGAFLSLVYNIGIGAHDGIKGDFADSDLLDLFNHGQVLLASQQFPLWNKAHVAGVLTVLPGLTARRVAEQQMFLTPDGQGRIS